MSSDTSFTFDFDLLNNVSLLEGLGFDPADGYFISSSSSSSSFSHHHQPQVSLALSFYAYFTPILILIGIVGNAMSLVVFLSRTMRRLSASTYLGALSISDIAALICHVTVDWLRRGMPSIGREAQVQRSSYGLASVTSSSISSSSTSSPSIFEEQGMCQVHMYLSYVTRFLSAWIVVTFTLERYIGVCHPLKRHGMFFGNKSSRKILFALLIASLILSSYKPILTGRYKYRVDGGRVIARCSRNPSYPMLSFVLDSIFAVSISLIPFFIISVLNTLTICRLRRRFRRNLRMHVVTRESIVRMEFTVIFLIISFVFIALNIPFFGFWCHRFLMSFYSTNSNLNASGSAKWNEHTYQSLFILSRILFYTNYAINFFLYSVSGACFRRQLRLMFAKRRYDRRGGAGVGGGGGDGRGGGGGRGSVGTHHYHRQTSHSQSQQSHSCTFPRMMGVAGGTSHVDNETNQSSTPGSWL